MTIISPSITQHTIVLCIEKRERGIATQAALAKAGFRVVVALGLYDALKIVAEEMPHLIITEVILSDGTAGTLFDKLQAHEMLKKTPIMAHVLKKTKEELTPLSTRKFAGFFLGPFEARGFLAKVHEVIRAHCVVSPYFIEAEALGLKPELTISIDAAVMGRAGEQMVSRSTTEVDPAASLVCVPSSADLGPAVLRMATNLRAGDEIFNLFPISRIIGAGRKWVLGLPEFKVGGNQAKDIEKLKKVVMYEPSEARFQGFSELLKGYDIELVHAKSLPMATALVKRDFESLACVYLHELLNDASSIEWKAVYAKLPGARRPSLIVGMTSQNARSTNEIRFIKRPFGLGIFVEMLQACMERPEEIAAAAGKNAAITISGVQVKYQAPATLIGLDETGGVLQVRFPLLKGSRLNITHAFLQTAWEGKVQVHVVASAPSEAKPDIWHARFDAIEAGMSKVKYWEKLAKHIAALPPAGVKPAA
jgi:DNA-binding response OmpR family regulator